MTCSVRLSAENSPYRSAKIAHFPPKCPTPNSVRAYSRCGECVTSPHTEGVSHRKMAHTPQKASGCGTLWRKRVYLHIVTLNQYEIICSFPHSCSYSGSACIRSSDYPGIGALQHINHLGLKVHGSRRHASCLQYLFKFLGLHLAV